MIKKDFMTTLTILMLLAGTQAAFAAEPRLIAQHQDWGSYVIDEGGNRVCYMASKPMKQEGVKNGKARGDVYALITDRPAEGTKNVFSYVAGYTYKSGSEAAVLLDKTKFMLFTKDDSAWTKTQESDNAVTAALRKASKLVVKGISSHGTATADTFSLKGSAAAYEDINRECGPKPGAAGKRAK